MNTQTSGSSAPIAVGAGGRDQERRRGTQGEEDLGGSVQNRLHRAGKYEMFVIFKQKKKQDFSTVILENKYIILCHIKVVVNAQGFFTFMHPMHENKKTCV